MMAPELSIVILHMGSSEVGFRLLELLERTAAELVGQLYETVVLGDRGAAAAGDRRVIVERPPKTHGDAFRLALGLARGRFIVTLDGDLSHPPEVLRDLWAAREDADIVVASRYVPGGRARLPVIRRILSRALNLWFSRALSLPVQDFSSGYRLYRAEVLRSLPPTQSRGHAVLPEILITAYAEGWAIKEIPFEHAAVGSSRPSWLARFALEFAAAFLRLWKLRWSIFCADYDYRAFNSRIWLQRYWHRCRYRFSLGFAGNGRTLDAGCGSSRILVGLAHAVGLDISPAKLRFMRRFGKPLVRGSVTALPFRGSSFDVVLCSQVIEHLPQPDSDLAIRELVRVLREGGRLILGTPDYGRREWRLTEKAYALMAPWGYADEHVTHYTHASLLDRLTALGIVVDDERYILRGELIVTGRKVPRRCELERTHALDD